jgi:hypothetical protein
MHGGDGEGMKSFHRCQLRVVLHLELSVVLVLLIPKRLTK